MSEEYEEYPDEYLDERGELKPCPFCGKEPKPTMSECIDEHDWDGEPYYYCPAPECPTSGYYTLDEWNTRPIEDALNARIAELEAERRWIPVSEKPTKSDWYLIMYQGYRVPDAGYYDVEAGWLSDIPTPDCWMPLPEPPEVEQ